uniref:hypothetical protein n=1 Tax=uncultured Tenacibaculum sp. TaxID=174713 RepID=UPI002638E51F|nr:hypothetical protein [uncultured Tenacibaculum sp.]
MSALLTVGLMFGAIMSHLTILGIEHDGNGGILFISAIVALISGLILLFSYRKSIPFLKI